MKAIAYTIFVSVLLTSSAQAIDLGTTSEDGSKSNPEVLGRKSFSTEDVAIQSVNEGCLEYCYTGVCIWVICDVYGNCDWETSEKVGHTTPDFVVSSYRHPGKNPWTEAKSAYGELAESAAQEITSSFIPEMVGGGMNWSDHNLKDHTERPEERREDQRQLWFKEVAVIGNPAIDEHREIIESASLHACPVDFDEFEPYFQSEFDAIAWRGFSAQTMLRYESWLPGAREIGKSAIFSWGSVHPRVGQVTGTEGPKAAAVAAQRAIDIVTREDQMRVYNYPYDFVYPPNYRDPSNEATDKWLMVHPAKEHQCVTFGQDNDYAVIDDGARNSESENYGYIYWPFVECCVPVEGYILVGTIDITPICIDL